MEFQWIFKAYFVFFRVLGCRLRRKVFSPGFLVLFFSSSGVPFAAQSFFPQDFCFFSHVFSSTPQYGNSLKFWVHHGSKIDLKRYF